MSVTADIREKRERIVRQLGVAHDPASVAGRVTTILSHPVTVGRALGRRLARR